MTCKLVIWLNLNREKFYSSRLEWLIHTGFVQCQLEGSSLVLCHFWEGGRGEGEERRRINKLSGQDQSLWLSSFTSSRNWPLKKQLSSAKCLKDEVCDKHYNVKRLSVHWSPSSISPSLHTCHEEGIYICILSLVIQTAVTWRPQLGGGLQVQLHPCTVSQKHTKVLLCSLLFLPASLKCLSYLYLHHQSCGKGPQTINPSKTRNKVN